MKLGFKPLPLTAIDLRFGLTRNFGAPSLDLPRKYDVEDEKGDITGPRDQGENMCTAYALSEIGSDEHGIPMSPDFQAMLISLIAGLPVYQWGASIRNAMKSGNLFGFLPVDKCPFKWEEKGEAFVCEPANWPPELLTIAEQYRMPGGYFLVDGPYDAFDNFRAQLFQHRPDNGIAIGIPWYRSFNDADEHNGFIPEPVGFIGWHAITVKGFRRVDGMEVLRVRSWDGKKFGNRSYGYFTRERFNQVMAVQGAEGRMFKDVAEDLVEALKNERLSLREIYLNFYYKLIFYRSNPNMFKSLTALMDFITTLWSKRSAPQPQTLPDIDAAEVPPPPKIEPPKPVPPPTPPPAPKPAPKPVYDFSTPKAAYRSTRMLCDEMGVPYAKTLLINGKKYSRKDRICACIYQESGFKNTAKYENKDPKTGQVWSTDWGIVQVNDHYHIGKGKTFPSLQYLLDNPEKAVRWMIKMELAGELRLWSSYKFGHYKKWLTDNSPMWKLKG